MVSSWYVVMVNPEGNQVIDFTNDFEKAYLEYTRLNRMYPTDEYHVVQEDQLSKYFVMND